MAVTFFVVFSFEHHPFAVNVVKVSIITYFIIAMRLPHGAAHAYFLRYPCNKPARRLAYLRFMMS
eukprot:5926765-Pleurochrysis_carterae.AAC.1